MNLTVRGFQRWGALSRSRSEVHQVSGGVSVLTDTSRQPTGLHLAWLLSVTIAGAFVTALIIATGDLVTYWPLYVVPVVLASLAYHAPGAIVSVALCGAVVVLLAYGGGYEVPVSALVLGALAFAVSGLAIGIQTQRYQRQRARLEQDATRDALTGAHCADYFADRLAEEARRSARYGTSFTLCLVRPVGFADFQHLYGRVKADLLLERFAEVLRLSLRNTDIVGRFGTDLFAVIMPSTTAEEARAVGERAASAIGEAEFEGDALEPVVHCTAQVVSAAYPQDAADADALLAAALDRLGASASTAKDTRSETARPGALGLGDASS